MFSCSLETCIQKMCRLATLIWPVNVCKWLFSWYVSPVMSCWLDQGVFPDSSWDRLRPPVNPLPLLVMWETDQHMKKLICKEYTLYKKHLNVIRPKHFLHKTIIEEKVDILFYFWQLFSPVVFLTCLMLTVLRQSQKVCCNLFMHDRVNLNWVNSSINLFPLHCLH